MSPLVLDEADGNFNTASKDNLSVWRVAGTNERASLTLQPSDARNKHWNLHTYSDSYESGGGFPFYFAFMGASSVLITA